MIKLLHGTTGCPLKMGKQEWKGADIIPIHKKRNKEEPLNYKQESLTSIKCKICKMVI